MQSNFVDFMGKAALLRNRVPRKKQIATMRRMIRKTIN